MRALCRTLDWAATPLGPVERWPASLRTAAGLVLAAPTPMIVLWGPELVQIYNGGYREVMGTKHPAGLGQPTRECWPEVWDFNAPLYRSVTERGESFTFTDQRLVIERHGHAEAAYFTLTYSPVPDGGVGGVLVTVFETTAQVRARNAREGERERLLAEAEAARAALGASEAKWRFALAVADLGAWEIDLATKDAWRSLKHDRIFGYDALLPEWSYDTFLAHVVPEDREAVAASFGTALDTAGPWDFTCRIRRADGEERWVAARGEPVTEAAGAPVRLVGVVRDVTADREAEEVLRGAKEAAEAANRAKSEFLAVMSHELRTPLNAIGGYTELLNLGIHGPVTEAQRNALERIQHSQRHLLGLINEVLNYTRLESGAVHYNLQDVTVRETLTAAETLVEPQARAERLNLTVDGCGADLVVRADPEKLRQILVNLLSNAVKFTDAGGHIELTCESHAEHVHVAVRDTGIGIPAAKLQTIFEPFVQVRADLARTAEGTGLGLSISRDLARGMGGDLTARSTPGEGSTFTLQLPRA